MYTLIALLFPSIVGVKVINDLHKKLTLLEIIYYYGVLVLISTILNNIMSYAFFGITRNVSNSLEKFPIFLLRPQFLLPL